jgi:hypothetical protein
LFQNLFKDLLFQHVFEFFSFSRPIVSSRLPSSCSGRQLRALFFKAAISLPDKMVAVKKPAADGGVPEEELLGVLALVGLIYFTAAGGAYGRSVHMLLC